MVTEIKLLKSLLVCFLVVVQVSSPTLIVERAGSNAWTHKSWRVREEFAKTVTSAIGLFASTELPLQRAILPSVCCLLLFHKAFSLQFDKIQNA